MLCFPCPRCALHDVFSEFRVRTSSRGSAATVTVLRILRRIAMGLRASDSRLGSLVPRR
jgi:hypothetical protein